MASEKDWQQDISTTVDIHTNKLTNHENRLAQAETNIADHEKRINNIETTSDIGQFATRIQAVEDKNTEQDGAIDTLKQNVSDNLQTAKQYTDTKLANYTTKTENSNTLEQAKQYSNSKADSTLEQAKQYANTKTTNTLEQANNYANQKFLPLSGGALTNGRIISRNVNNDCLRLYGGIPTDSNGKEQGAMLILNGRERLVTDTTINNRDITGCIRIVDLQGKLHDFIVSGDGLCCWNNKHIVRSVNGINADATGNVSGIVTTATAQTISAQHNFSAGVKIGGCLITVG